MKPVAWESSTITRALYFSASAQIPSSGAMVRHADTPSVAIIRTESAAFLQDLLKMAMSRPIALPFRLAQTDPVDDAGVFVRR